MPAWLTTRTGRPSTPILPIPPILPTLPGPATPLIFVATYVGLAVGRVPGLRLDRTGIALAGAALMLATGAIGLNEAVRAIDGRTIALLLVMMTLVAPLQLSGAFGRVVVWVSARAAHPAALLAAVIFASGALSALFVNDTVCVAFTPLILELAALRRHNPLPYLLALATGSNIGSTATIVGNPQNILIGSVSRIGPVRFTAALAPIAATGLAMDVLVIWMMFRRELYRHAEDRRDLTPHAAAARARSLTARDVVQTIDWRLLWLFVGLFVVVAAAERAGIDHRLFDLLAPFGVDTLAGLSATTAVLSNVISNVPAVMLFTRLVPHLPDPSRAWLALAMSSTLAGNLTILGSIANLIVIEGARRRGVVVGFWDYARVGIPITVTTVVFGIWWLSWAG